MAEEYIVEKERSQLQTSGLSFRFTVVEKNNFQLTTSPETACLDYEKLVFPLRIRKWNPGDWFIPLGLGKKKKVSDLLVDLKIPVHRKAEIKVLVSGNSIVWVAGLRIDDRFKVDANTQKILVITSEKR